MWVIFAKEHAHIHADQHQYRGGQERGQSEFPRIEMIGQDDWQGPTKHPVFGHDDVDGGDDLEE